ncbi:MAG: ABC transporter permease [Dehalococcoidia bacterium]
MIKTWLELLNGAWTGVATHKLRSFLTILGIVIGVTAVIALMSLGRGAQAEILSRIESLGSNLMFVQPGATSLGEVREAAGSAGTLTQEDANAILEEVPYISQVAPTSSSSLQLIFRDENTRATVMGITPSYFQVYNTELTQGTFISSYDYNEFRMVAVIGPELKETLFGDSDALGQTVRMENNVVVRVIGILERQGESMVNQTDNALLIPLSVLQQTVAQQKTSQAENVVNSIAMALSEEGKTEYVSEEITTLLRDRHQLSPSEENDFRITSMEEIASTVSEAMGTMTLLLGAIAAISLLVGGIGVMNIMLVSVLERTREIGIRKALGAKGRDIWGQFLLESALLALTGGIIGVIIGWAIAIAVEYSGLMTTVVAPDIVILAVSVSVGVGLFFGFYPAWNASRLDPIEALRHE